QDELVPRRALGRRAAARLDRARIREPPAAADLRRADREPRPRHERRDHAAPLPDQPLRDHDPDGDPRPRDGRQDAQARDRARSWQAASRGGRGGVHDPRNRFRTVAAEAIRSLGANLSTTFAATTTVLIGMFMHGLVVGLGSWALSLSDHYKKQLLVNVYFCTDLRCGK